MIDKAKYYQNNDSVVRQVLGLKSKSASELRVIYKNLFLDECSPYANKDQLIPKIAYRIQELAFGGLSRQTKSRFESISKKGISNLSSFKSRGSTDLAPGTKICKEYNGTIYQIEVLKEGFEFDGQKWRSLSAIATKITGTKWNGPKFFGMRS